MSRDRFGVTGLISQRLQLQTQVAVASLGWCHKEGECAKLCARRSVCFCSQSGGGVSILSAYNGAAIMRLR